MLLVLPYCFVSFSVVGVCWFVCFFARFSSCSIYRKLLLCNLQCMKCCSIPYEFIGRVISQTTDHPSHLTSEREKK